MTGDALTISHFSHEWARVDANGAVTHLDIDVARSVVAQEGCDTIVRAVAALVACAYERGHADAHVALPAYGCARETAGYPKCDGPCGNDATCVSAVCPHDSWKPVRDIA